MKINDRVLHHTLEGCTDPQRAGIIVNDLEGGHVVKWHIKYPSGIETDVLAWYEPQELIPFVEAEIATADKQREWDWKADREKEAKVGA